MESLEEPYDRELFEILIADYDYRDSEETIKALNLFYTRLLEARKEALSIRNDPLTQSEVLTVGETRDAAAHELLT
jgi:hypothetical protein